MSNENKFNNIITKFLVILFVLITGYLFIVSMFSTVYISETENVYYISDSFIKNLLVLALVTFFLIFFKEKIKSIISGNDKKMVVFNTIILSAILLFFILSSRFYPLYDQAKVLNVVKHMFVYDYSDFMPGGYIDKCDVQKGMTLYFFFVSKILGKISITAIQLLNGLYIIISNYFIYKFSKIIFGNNKASLVHLSVCMYAPLWLYSSFVYGTLPSFMFGVIAIYLFVKIRNSEYSKATRKYIDILILSISLSISIVFKTNSIIILLAIVLLSILFLIIDKNKIAYLVIIFLALTFYMISSRMVDSYINNVTKMNMQGIPRTAHMAMALMENSDRGPGWYNGYSEEVYVKNGFDKEKASNESVESIKESLNGFKNNPANFVSFVSRKIVSQWNDPTYESLFIQYGRDSLGNMPMWLKYLTNPTSKLNKFVRFIFDIIQLYILFGVLSYFTINPESINVNKLIPGIVILGGFFFHILWEAKSQYILIYFVLLIPYSVIGLSKLINELSAKKFKELITSKRNNIKISILILIIVFTAIVPAGSVFGKILKPSWKTEQYREVTNSETNNYKVAGTLDKDYAAALTMPKMSRKKGNYTIVLADNENMVLCPVSKEKESTEVEFREILEDSIDNTVILFTENNDEYSIRFQMSQRVLDVENGVIDEGNQLQQWDYNGDMGQLFRLEQIENEKYIITCNNFVIGIDDENKPIFVKKGDDNVAYVYIREY